MKREIIPFKPNSLVSLNTICYTFVRLNVC